MMFTTRHLWSINVFISTKRTRMLLVRKLPEWVEKLPGGAHVREVGWDNGVHRSGGTEEPTGGL